MILLTACEGGMMSRFQAQTNAVLEVELNKLQVELGLRQNRDLNHRNPDAPAPVEAPVEAPAEAPAEEAKA